MPEELTALEFSLHDVIGGQPLTPDTVDLPTLRGFLQEVETLIKGDVEAANLADSRVRIESGSVKVVTLVAALLAANVEADLAKLDQTGDLDAIQPKRADVIENWQKRARRMPNRSYSLTTAQHKRALSISKESQLQHGSENGWVNVEKYLTGKVVDLGGKQNPNVHLVLTDSGESIQVSASQQQLGEEKENQLYKDVAVQVQAEQHLHTKALRNLRLIRFVPQTNAVDEQALAALWQKGREAWHDVKSAAGWVDALRGNS